MAQGSTTALAYDYTTKAERVEVVASSGGGATAYTYLNVATSTNATLVQAGSHSGFSIQVFNIGTVVAFLKLYNKATQPIPGTDTPVKNIAIPIPITGQGAAGVVINVPSGVQFPLGIGFAITGAVALLDNTNVTAANTILLNLDWL
jgi:pantoate kinase